jgi:hypothetical protein
MTPAEKIEKVKADFSLLTEAQQDFIVGIIDALLFAASSGKNTSALTEAKQEYIFGIIDALTVAVSSDINEFVE